MIFICNSKVLRLRPLFDIQLQSTGPSVDRTFKTATSTITMSSDWQHGLCSCFDNIGICVIAYLVPCYTFGKNAEAVGDSCCLCGVAFFVPFLNICAALSLRGKLREQKGIDGSCLGDFFTILFCPLCAMVQEAQESQGIGSNYMVRE